MSATIEHLSADIYHATSAWGSTSMKAMRQGPPARVIWQRQHQTDSAAREIGTAVHCGVLEPDRFMTTYAHKPDGLSFSTREGKDWRIAQGGKTILSHADWTTIAAIIAAVQAKPSVNAALNASLEREASIFWDHADTNEPCKARPDWFTDAHLYDLKVSRYAGRGMAYRAFVEGWMHQLAHYRTGLSALGLGELGARLVVVSSAAPHYVWTLQVKVDALDLLALENDATIFALAHHRKTDIWPDTPDEWEPIEPPASALVTTGVLDSIALIEEVE